MANSVGVRLPKALVEVGRENPNVWAVDADLSKSTYTSLFAKEFPDRFVSCGIAEANMVGVAAGLAMSGKIPFASSFSCFILNKGFEQLRVAVAYSQANVKIVGTHSGISIGEDGPSQMSIEETSLACSLPGFTVFTPADEVATRALVRLAARHAGPVFIRTGRLKVPGDGDWYPVDLGTNSFGQGIAVTPLQMLMSASAIANQGKMATPHVLYAMLRDGHQYNVPLQYAGSPITADTARTLNEMLAISLEQESSQALLPGYRLAGKTGTAQIPTEYGYDASQTNASFIGWGPVDDPQIMIFVWLYKPSASIWSSETAAPVFAQVAEQTVIMLNIPPDLVGNQYGSR